MSKQSSKLQKQTKHNVLWNQGVKVAVIILSLWFFKFSANQAVNYVINLYAKWPLRTLENIIIDAASCKVASFLAIQLCKSRNLICFLFNNNIFYRARARAMEKENLAPIFCFPTRYGFFLLYDIIMGIKGVQKWKYLQSWLKNLPT